MTTAGERDDRGYGYDDEAYPSPYRAAAGYYRASHAVPDHVDAGYPAEPYPAAEPGYRPPAYETYQPDPYRTDAYPGNTYPGGRSPYPAAPAAYPPVDYPPPGVDYPRRNGDYQGNGNGRHHANGRYPAPQRPPAGPLPRRSGAVPVASRPVRHGGQDGDREAAPDADGGNRRRRRLPLWQELPLLLVIAFCLAVLIRSFLLQAFFIPSGSMEDTLIAGDRVLVNKVVYNFREPSRGEVVVFRGTDAWAPLATDDGGAGAFARVGRTLGDLVGISRPSEKDYIKRVIGVPGDVVSCCDEEGRVLVNGSAVNEPYVIRDSPLTDIPDGVRDCRSRQFDEVVVQPGQLFVMGDHRQRSQDSRCQGPVPIDNVIGRAFIVVWPSDRWSGLSATDAFVDVPAPATVTAAGDPGGTDAGPVVPTGSGAGGLAIVLPILLPFGMAAPALSRRGGNIGFRPARSRLVGRGTGRRLAE